MREIGLVSVVVRSVPEEEGAVVRDVAGEEGAVVFGELALDEGMIKDARRATS